MNSRSSRNLPFQRQPLASATTSQYDDLKISRFFSSTTCSHFQNSQAFRKLSPYRPKEVDQGLAFREDDLDLDELAQVFSNRLDSPSFANRLLRVLHARRVDGTLDLDLPAELTSRLRKFPTAFDEGLQWLRANHPVDEDAAIVERIEREESAEEQESPAQLMERAEELKLYQPQSGHFRAKLSETGDVYGESELDKIRAANIAEAEREEKELEENINKLREETKEKFGELQVQPENALEVSDGQRPLNTYEKWKFRLKTSAESKLTLDSPEVAAKTKLRRLLPSFIFVSFGTILCYASSQYWVPPIRSERLWPDTTLSVATVLALISANTFIWLLWSFPPAWRLLVRYFITSPATPVPFSMFGSTVSHQSFRHLAINMAFVLLMGMSLHEDVGRGTMLAVYVAGGLVGNFTSLMNFTLRNILISSTLGASASASAVLAMYCTIHANDRFHLFFLPKEWQDKANFSGWWFLAALLTAECIGFLSPIKTIDYAAHLGGYLVGIVSGLWWKRNRDQKRARRREMSEEQELNWFEKILGKRPSGER